MTSVETSGATTLCPGCGALVEQPRMGRRIWCSDHCRKRSLYGSDCIDCGARTNGSDGYQGEQRCGACAGRYSGELAIAAARPHRELIERLWAEGLTTREIGERVGSPTLNISTKRAAGYDLPHRHSPERIARATAGSHDRLARARQVKAGATSERPPARPTTNEGT